MSGRRRGRNTDGDGRQVDRSRDADCDGNERDGKLNWEDTDDVAWENPSVFGTVKLVAK